MNDDNYKFSIFSEITFLIYTTKLSDIQVILKIILASLTLLICTYIFILKGTEIYMISIS